jgi:putative nucleotidyltransferase with HDIG domain
MVGAADTALVRVADHVIESLWRRDPATALHSMRVGQIATDVATELGLAPAMVERTRFGGLLHDSGKLVVDLDVLQKPGALSDAERGIIELHPSHGDELLAGLGVPEDIRRLARGHHERLDGLGYPDHLAGDQLSIEQRIISAVDVYEAIRGVRPYREALDHAGAMVELERRAGWHLDPDVIAAIGRVGRD